MRAFALVVALWHALVAVPCGLVWRRVRERLAWRRDRRMSEAEFHARARALEGRPPRVVR